MSDKYTLEKWSAERKALHGFPAERLGAVQEGDMQRLIKALAYYTKNVQGMLDANEITNAGEEHEQAKTLLARLQPRED